MSLANDFVVYAISMGKLTAIHKDVFLSTQAAIPSRPENVGPYTVVVDTGGPAAILSHDARYPRPRIQVAVSAASSTVAKTKALELFAISCNLHNVTLNGTFYLKITAVQEVMDMQQDPNSRPRWGFNLESEHDATQ